MWGSFSRDTMEERWGWIECPVQVVIGSESGTWWSRGRGPGAKQFEQTRAYLPPNELERRLAKFPKVRCDEIEGAGHMIHFDRPDELNRTIADFLTQLEPTSA
jgi:pimeloyl-ACP methyl ester carboxylesterase